MDRGQQRREQYYVKMMMSENNKSQKSDIKKEFNYDEKLGINRKSDIGSFDRKDVDTIINEIKTDEVKRLRAKKEKKSLIIFSIILFILVTIGVGCIVALIHLI